MSRASFIEAAGAALLGAVLAGSGFHLGLLLYSPYEASRVVILGVGLFYACYLLLRSPRRDGRVLAFTLWLAVSGVTLLLDPPVLFYLLSQLLMFWLIRCLCHHRRILHGIVDGVLCTVSLAAALWTFATTGSIALACWSLLLCQALFTMLERGDAATETSDSELTARFERARRGADAALRRASMTP